MGSRSKKGNNSNYNPVPRVTQADANNELGNLMKTQLGFVGTVFDNLLPRAESWVEGRPGLNNFRKRTNQLKDKVDGEIEDSPPGRLLEQLDQLLGVDRSGQPQNTDQSLAQLGLTPEQMEMAQKYINTEQGYNFSSPFNINTDRSNNYKV